MPRPLRSRVASAKPVQTSEASRAPSARLRAGPAWDKGSGSSSEMSDIYGVSDSELKRIAAEPTSKPAPTPAVPAQPQSAAAAKSRADAHQTVALTDSRRRRNTAMSRLDDLTTSSTVEQQPRPQSRGRRTSRPPARGRRGASATREAHTRHRADVSGLDIVDDSELFGDLDLDADIDSSSVDGETTAPGYRSAETSSFNIAMFKRGRSRQSSVAGRDDAPIRPSSRGPNTPGFSSTFNLGAFKRRPRERSILGTGRKERAEYTDTELAPGGDDEAAVESGLDSDLELPDIEAASPSRRRTRSSAAAAAAARESLPPTNPSPAADSRKRKSTDAHEGSSKRPALASSDDEQQSIESDSELSPPPLSDSASTPPHVPPVYDDDEDVMAPPASSSGSSDGSPGFWPSLRGVATGRLRRGRSNSRRTPAPDDAASDISSPPSLTHSPNYANARNKGKGRAAAAAQHRRSPEKLTTAELTSMLPRRRRRAASNAPEDEDDEIDRLAVAGGADELAYGGGSRGTRSSRKPTRPLAESSNASAAKGPNSHRGSRGRKGNRRTYGSRGGLAAGSDKENQSAAAATADDEGEEEATINVADESSEAVHDDTFDTTADTIVPPPDLGEELKEAAKKFKEVDKWELEFEEITEPSSPGIDAR